ncbi:MAG: electron transfer flavoprotein subunit beta/FixA family protein [Chloroflexi bacterium]|nr:electron transfer flavoprotein subunit beta/FixA family protein [Chloroflexota bacterium]
MDIVVCIKQVPDPEHFSKIVLDAKTKLVRREGIPVVVNQVDKHALEAALQIREKFSGRVTVISMGPPQAREAIEEAFAMGADGGVLLSDRAFAGADSLTTAYTLAQAIKKFSPFDLILLGNETADSGTRQVAPQLAEFLDVPHVTNVRTIGFNSGDTLIVERSMENGHMKIEVRLPAVLAVNRTINEPRIPSVIDIMQVATKEIKVCGLADLGLSSEDVGLVGSPTQMANLFESRRERRREILDGAAVTAARQAVERLRELNAL